MVGGPAGLDRAADDVGRPLGLGQGDPGLDAVKPSALGARALQPLAVGDAAPGHQGSLSSAGCAGPQVLVWSGGSVSGPGIVAAPAPVVTGGHGAPMQYDVIDSEPPK